MTKAELIKRVDYLEKKIARFEKRQTVNYIGEDERECSTCHDIKPYSEFSPSYEGRRQSSCKKCRAKKATERNNMRY